VDLHSCSIGFLKRALNSASIYGRKKRFSLLGTRGASKERHDALNVCGLRDRFSDVLLHDDSGGNSMIHEAIEKALSGEDLSRSELKAVMEELSSGRVTQVQFAALITALSLKGMTKDEDIAIGSEQARVTAGASQSRGATGAGHDTGYQECSEFHHLATMLIRQGNDLSKKEAENAMEEILSGRADDATIASFLAALRFKGETVDELVGFATAMRRHATAVFSRLRLPPGAVLVDTAGTGGDARGTFNISTAAAFVIAGAGVHVAKHGNRAFTSRCGSADVLEELGVRMDLPMERVARAIEEIGIGFLYAPAAHTAMRHAMTARQELKVRTVFNLLGPLTNPAGASAQIVGVYDASLTELLARALGELGVRRAMVVHGADGLDEISISGETYIAELRDGVVRSYAAAPEDFGLSRAPVESIQGGDAKHNSKIIKHVLGHRDAPHEHGPHRDIVLANSAAALVAAGRATDFLDAIRLAAESIDSGAARARLDALVAFSQEEKPLGQTAL
jgi:anthranilate phosphoribosyltransferase